MWLSELAKRLFPFGIRGLDGEKDELFAPWFWVTYQRLIYKDRDGVIIHHEKKKHEEDCFIFLGSPLFFFNGLKMKRLLNEPLL